MRIEGSVTAISWIPSEAIEGLPKLPFELGVGHYDEPPPDRLEPGDLGRLRDADRFREANELSAWIEVEDGAIVGAGYGGGGLVGSTTFNLGPKKIVVPGVAFDVLRPEPEISGDRARFVQTVGGRAGFPAPRTVKGGPMFRIHSATAWTTLALTLHADGRVEHELVGASPFPRHWIYDSEGALSQKTGTVDFKTWYRESHGDKTPWGDEESPALVTAAETTLERELSASLMGSGEKFYRRNLGEGAVLVTQGAEGDTLYLILDGVFGVEVDGEQIAEVGPGTMVGERGALEGGVRTATLRALTDCRVVVIPAQHVGDEELATLAADRHREG
ncbi:MAG TPA: cyclic nucleotide-binding domain-containing protein [Gaiellaceae bacterium]|nr:cyclic nucleotide-binding domain-containing protein [Gaiellaceae bacterium]